MANSYLYRMPAGAVGDVTRTHPQNVFPALIDATAPPTAFGQAVVVDPTTQGVRPIVAGDSALDSIYGITVRPYPTQQASGGMSSTYGGGAPNPAQPVDVLRSGSILVTVPAGQTPVKGGRVFIWYAASSGAHVQGGFETAATGGSTFELDEKSSFQGGVDASNVCELCFNI